LSEGLDNIFQEILEELPTDLHAQAQNDFDYLLSTNIRSYEALLNVAKTPNTDLKARIIACWVLGKIRDKKTVQVLLAAFKDQDINLQWEAAKSLGYLGSKRAVNHLITSLLKAHTAETRAAAAYALGHIQDGRAIDPLLQVLRSKHEEARVRGHAAEALARFKDSKIVDGLINELRDSQPEVRFWAAYALGQIGSKRALQELEHLAENDHAEVPNWWKVSEEASEAINNIKHSI
jgi:HEAT repeat protein